MPDLKYPTAKLRQLTAATCIDRRTMILDWSGRKLGRLCKWRLAAKAQHAANVADILESVKVHVASHKSATLDCPIDGHDDESWWFSVDHESNVLYDAFKSSAFRSEIKKQRTTSELTIASGSPTSCGPRKARTIADNSGKTLLDFFSEPRHSKWRFQAFRED